MIKQIHLYCVKIKISGVKWIEIWTMKNLTKSKRFYNAQDYSKDMLI